MNKKFYDIVTDVGECLLFLKSVSQCAITNKISSKLVNEQIWKVTTQSASTTALAGFFVGAVMTVQFTMQVKEFGALGYLGGLATSGTIREIGPLLIAFMFSGKIGAFTSAELGTMKVTEQIDAIRCLGADPIQEIVVPRFIGIIISSFFLLIIGLLMSVGGGLLMGQVFSGITPEQYVRHIPSIVTSFSIFNGLLKCFVFAAVLATICTYKGYTTTGGAKGVGQSVIKTAVGTMICIVLADWMTSYFSDTALSLYMEW